jgi:hypothetical protein
MKKMILIFRECRTLVGKHKLYFLSPLLLLLCVLAVLFFHFGPSVVVAFIYAGV